MYQVYVTGSFAVNVQCNYSMKNCSNLNLFLFSKKNTLAETLSPKAQFQKATRFTTDSFKSVQFSIQFIYTAPIPSKCFLKALYNSTIHTFKLIL